MKFKLSYSILIFSFFIISCQKEKGQEISKVKSENATSQHSIMVELLKKRSFKEDFLGNNHGVVSTSPKFYFKGDLSKMPFEIFLSNYSNFKN